jgi:hypothetical protein
MNNYPDTTCAHIHTHNLNIESTLAVWANLLSHTQTTIEKQPKAKKQTFPKPVVLCAIIRASQYTKKTNEKKPKVVRNGVFQKTELLNQE